MTIWSSAPAGLKEKAERLIKADGEANEVIQYLVKQIEGSEDPSEKAKVPAAEYDRKWIISQLLPSRKLVTFLSNKSKLATVVEKTGELSLEARWKDYNVILMLPLPKRIKPQYNLVFSNLGSNQSWLVLTTPEPPSDLIEELKKRVAYSDFKVNPAQAVPAYTGAQEGLLYFLSEFVFFGFKKPLVLVMIVEIESISFTTVTSRTFNVVVKLLDDRQFEFEKISHEFHSRILEFIELHNLDDESLAENRKAKRQRTGLSELETAIEEESKGQGNSKKRENDNDNGDSEDEASFEDEDEAGDEDEDEGDEEDNEDDEE